MLSSSQVTPPVSDKTDFARGSSLDLRNNNVAVTFTGLTSYPSQVPFDPPERYPEYRGQNVDASNRVYAGVRDTLARLGLDREHFNTPRWNPLKGIIEPGMTVFVKPNTVRHYHVKGKDIFSVIVHASVLRPVLDYICLALQGSGRIIIGDSQVLFGHFDEAITIARIKDLLTWYGDQTTISLECFDLRIYRRVRTWLHGEWGKEKVEMDPRGYTMIDLGMASELRDQDPNLLGMEAVSSRNMRKHHSGGHHQYVFPNSVLQSDAVISIPKLKTHRRTAVTLAIKNFMGIPAWKDSLAHYRKGSPAEGGDQYPHSSWRKRLHTELRDMAETVGWVPAIFVLTVAQKVLWATGKVLPFKDNVTNGMWYGNDTLWRTLSDLNRAVFYCDKQGKLRDTPQRRYLCLMDGIIGGEKNGPIACDPVTPGVLMASFNPVTMDAVAATLMGFDVEHIPLITHTMESRNSSHPLFWSGKECIRVFDEEMVFDLQEFAIHRNLHFVPHPDWKGRIERA